MGRLGAVSGKGEPCSPESHYRRWSTSPLSLPWLSFEYRYMEKQQGLESASLACDNKPIALVSRKTTPDAGLILGSLLM